MERLVGDAEGDAEEEDDEMTPPIGCFSMLLADRSFDDDRSRMLCLKYILLSCDYVEDYIGRDLRLSYVYLYIRFDSSVLVHII